jgi:hypothetical protein
MNHGGSSDFVGGSMMFFWRFPWGFCGDWDSMGFSGMYFTKLVKFTGSLGEFYGGHEPTRPYLGRITEVIPKGQMVNH